jgi:glyoxylase-like metal-dependent hydrolase (beta-lactamase superfamily II)
MSSQVKEPSTYSGLTIPNSDVTVKVSIIDSTTRIGIPFALLLSPAVDGLPTYECPAYSFLIEHTSSKSKLLFDLGVRKDWENYAPSLVKRIKDGEWKCEVEENVADILVKHGVDLASITAIVWSHHHWDHIGDPSTFPPSTDLVVGPGFKKALTPGWPTNPEAPILESAYEGRIFHEISFENSVKIGQFKAIDYFADGSFYLLDTPGHVVGHLGALARIKDATGQQKFILMGGDAAHHGGELRPNAFVTLPDNISPNPLTGGKSVYAGRSICPGAIFIENGKVDGSGSERQYNKPFLAPSADLSADQNQALQTLEGLAEYDGHESVLIAIAHDSTLMDDLPFFPISLEEWKVEVAKDANRWRWLRDLDGEFEKST